MEQIRVLVNGARGRMGREVVRAVRAEDDLELVAELDLGDDLEGAIHRESVHVAVDFTVPESAVTNTETILRAGACPVVGTTGFRPEDISRLQDRARTLRRGGLIAPNFAIGAVVLMKLAAEAARYLPAVEIIELHHEGKLDAPSGTALKTIELIHERREASGSAEGRARNDRAKGSEERELVQGARGGRYLDIPVHSVRLPGLVAHQEVLLGAEGQLLTLRHDSLSRTSFMPGVILAVRKVPRLRELFYGLDRILET